MGLMHIVCVTIDSHDPAALAEFWNAALRWGGVAAASDGGGAVCGPADGGMYLEFVRVPESKTIKNRLHLGCNVGPIDVFDEEFERLQSLGAELDWREDFGAEVHPHYRNWVLRDPEGNEFCLGGGTWPEGAHTVRGAGLSLTAGTPTPLVLVATDRIEFRRGFCRGALPARRRGGSVHPSHAAAGGWHPAACPRARRVARSQSLQLCGSPVSLRYMTSPGSPR